MIDAAATARAWDEVVTESPEAARRVGAQDLGDQRLRKRRSVSS